MSGPGEHTAHLGELLPAYALGALDGAELRELEEHLATGCPECRRELDLWQGDLEELAATVTPLQPSEETRRRILRLSGGGEATAARFPQAAEARPARRIPRWLALPIAALLALTVWSGVRQARLTGENERLRAERELLSEKIAGLDRELAVTRDDARRMAETLSIITAPQSRTVQLAGLGPTPGAVGHAFVDPRSHRAIFYAFDLPAPAPGKTYQLWWIAAGRPASAGTFDVDQHGHARLQVSGVEDVDDIQAWAVTVEPAGGVPQPTGAMVLKG
jgi:anti-sigma-K factor RskA